MKKILSLVLALALILTAVSALAQAVDSKEDEKPTASVLPTGTEEGNEPAISISFPDEVPAAAQTAIDAIKDAVEKKDLSSAFEGVTVDGVTNVSEIVVAQFEGECDKVTEDKILNIKFSTPYEAGKAVKVMIGIVGDDGVAWEQPIVGTVKDDTSIDMTIPAALFNKIGNKPFLIAICN